MLVLLAAAWDLRVRRIPNWLSLVGAAAGLGLNFAYFGWPGLGRSAQGLAVAFSVYFVLYLARAMGAGDVKLMAAVGSLTGTGNWLVIFLITALLGGAAALAMVAWHGRMRATLGNVRFIVAELLHFRAPHLSREELSIHGKGALTLPHGAVIAAGCLAFLLARQYGKP